MSEFVDYLHEVFSEFGRIYARRMFGGYGIYRDGLMFALVSDDTLYLKADNETAREFDSRGLAPFRYAKGGRMVSLSYFEAPEEIYDDPGQAAVWGRLAYDAAARDRSRGGG